MLIVAKKDGNMWFCIEYRRLNSMTVKNTYHLPRMDECVDALGDAEYFTTLDYYMGNWQMKIRKNYGPKTVLVCHAGTFHHTGMPFGQTDSPVCFPRALDMLLSK